MTISEIIENRIAVYRAANNAGDGDTYDVGGAEPAWIAESTDDVSVYAIGDRAYLVGNDGWGVRVSIEG